jgi:hypothetical protein
MSGEILQPSILLFIFRQSYYRNSCLFWGVLKLTTPVFLKTGKQSSSEANPRKNALEAQSDRSSNRLFLGSAKPMSATCEEGKY